MKMQIRFILLLALGICVVMAMPRAASTQAQVYHDKGEQYGEYCISDFLPGPWATEVLADLFEMNEDIDICFSGYYKWREKTVIDSKGRAHYVFTANDYGFLGIGVPSGDVLFRRIGADTWTISGDGELPLTEHYISVLNYIGKGKLKNLCMFYIWKLTINANGEVKVFIERDRVTVH